MFCTYTYVTFSLWGCYLERVVNWICLPFYLMQSVWEDNALLRKIRKLNSSVFCTGVLRVDRGWAMVESVSSDSMARLHGCLCFCQYSWPGRCLPKFTVIPIHKTCRGKREWWKFNAPTLRYESSNSDSESTFIYLSLGAKWCKKYCFLSRGSHEE